MKVLTRYYIHPRSMVQLPVYNTIAYCYLGDGLLLAFPNFLAMQAGRDTHIMVFKVPILLCYALIPNIKPVMLIAFYLLCS